MGSKREEERNEKIIRGLMKLPPNRRCINCNSLGPQYVCTNFWTFICTTCSGIHREFTHRVKSVSMAKFTFQEVDALQKGGNQRARDLFLKAWDPETERNKLVDNSNIDKLRGFIKSVYIDKKYSMDKSSDRPPRDPQNLRSQEDEMRRASSYHSYSQSPPYDFQYEERRYGKHAPSLTRKPGSDRGLYEGKLAGFLSPNRLSDYAKNDRFSNEGSNSRMSDYTGNGGVDLFKSDILSPSSQNETWSPFGESNSREVPSLHKSDVINSRFHPQPQRTVSLGSFGYFDSSSTSFKSFDSTSFPEVVSDLGHSAEVSHDKSTPGSSVSGAFAGLDLFNTPFAQQNASSTPPTGINSQLPESLLAQSVNVIQESSTSAVPSFSEQQPSEILQPSPLDLFTSPFQQQSVVSNKEEASNVVMSNDGGWATFDMAQNIEPIGTENSAPAAVPYSDGSILGNFNPFSTDESSSFQASPGHEPSASTFTFETTDNPFDAAAAAEGHPTQNVIEINKQTALHSASDAERLLGDGGYESLSGYGRVTTSSESEPPLSSLSSNFDITLNDFPIGPSEAGVDSLATDHKSSNPFDLPYDSDMESTNMLWNMSSLQVALPNFQMAATYDDGVNQLWFPQNPVPSFVPGGVSFDSSSGSMGYIAEQAPNTSITSIHTHGPVASVGGNPFA
ncbi:probable ADP-ribosylation factor GTPase-activating protein AGD14 isoform X2 [Salvia splendens]|uniref:probable ADP-ribosylation factor GTPase-activating protein AGD14 isoform X2 n=1 Tax=Salvia splendens TaxID=180675 RepID=UPI001C267E95|nr:probable ADP-ribosylation factor GTPase-activating protein AGD14 isoform X2 [Salvia splendens]